MGFRIRVLAPNAAWWDDSRFTLERLSLRNLHRFLCGAGRTFALRLLHQPQRLRLVRIVPEQRDHLILDAQHRVVELPFGGCGIVTRGGQRKLGIGLGLPFRLHRLKIIGDAFLRVTRIDRFTSDVKSICELKRLNIDTEINEE